MTNLGRTVSWLPTRSFLTYNIDKGKIIEKIQGAVLLACLGHVNIWLDINTILAQPPVWIGDQGEVVGGEFDFGSTQSFLGGQLVRFGPDTELRGPVPPPPAR